jgi:TM2 domain-containing membrane protein YozV
MADFQKILNMEKAGNYSPFPPRPTRLCLCRKAVGNRYVALTCMLMHTTAAPCPYDSRNNMASHKNKTFTTLLASVFGGVGAHRFYLAGRRDFWGWAHFATLPLSALLALTQPGQSLLFTCAPLVLSALAGFVEALAIGLTPDDKWDARHNPESGRVSSSGWPLALLLVLTLAGGATAVIAAMARTFDLLFTGGAYG